MVPLVGKVDFYGYICRVYYGFFKSIIKSPLLKDGFWIGFHHGRLALNGLHLGVDSGKIPFPDVQGFFLTFRLTQNVSQMMSV